MVDENVDPMPFSDVDIVITFRSGKTDLKSLQKALTGLETRMNSQTELSKIVLTETESIVKNSKAGMLRVITVKYYIE